MNIIEFSLLVWVSSVLAGFLGSLTGLGGGIIITPVLTLALGVDIRYAIGASLVSVIATSSGAAAAYVREGFSNIRIGMFLEIATTLGAVGGSAAGHQNAHQRHLHHLWPRSALFGLRFQPSATQAPGRSPAGPSCYPAEDER